MQGRYSDNPISRVPSGLWQDTTTVFSKSKTSSDRKSYSTFLYLRTYLLKVYGTYNVPCL